MTKKWERRLPWLIALAAIGGLLWVTYVINPVKVIEDEGVEPIGREIGVFAPALKCINGWETLRRGVDTDRDADNSISCAKRDPNGSLLMVAYRNDEGDLIVHDILNNRILEGESAKALFK